MRLCEPKRCCQIYVCLGVLPCNVHGHSQCGWRGTYHFHSRYTAIMGAQSRTKMRENIRTVRRIRWSRRRRTNSRRRQTFWRAKKRREAWTENKYEHRNIRVGYVCAVRYGVVCATFRRHLLSPRNNNNNYKNLKMFEHHLKFMSPSLGRFFASLRKSSWMFSGACRSRYGMFSSQLLCFLHTHHSHALCAGWGWVYTHSNWWSIIAKLRSKSTQGPFTCLRQSVFFSKGFRSSFRRCFGNRLKLKRRLLTHENIAHTKNNLPICLAVTAAMVCLKFRTIQHNLMINNNLMHHSFEYVRRTHRKIMNIRNCDVRNRFIISIMKTSTWWLKWRGSAARTFLISRFLWIRIYWKANVIIFKPARPRPYSFY